GDALPLGRVTIEPNAPAGGESLPNAGNYNFEDRIRLLGYDYDRRVYAPGDSLALTLFWEALRPSPGDYEVQIRLLDAEGNVLSTQQGRPGGGARPTTEWRPDETFVDTYDVSLAPVAAGQTAVIQIALVDAGTGARLNLIGDDGRWLDDVLRLSPVRLRE
ncbi:MAG: hypothetical protein DCC51_05030, partial [Anaerolineae bacterium]